MIVMSQDQFRDRAHAEPEIIPPGREPRGDRRTNSIFIRIDDRDGVRRVVLTRPGWPTIILVLMVLGLVVAAAFLVVAGLVLIWLPVLAAAILLALVSGALHQRWQRLWGWWSSR
jgi:hypothetical protein